MSPPVTFILPSLRNSTTAPTPTVPSSAFVTSHLPTISLALSAFLSSAEAKEAKKTIAPSPTSPAAFISLSLLLPCEFDHLAVGVGKRQGRVVELVDRDVRRLVLLAPLDGDRELLAAELV